MTARAVRSWVVAGCSTAPFERLGSTGRRRRGRVRGGRQLLEPTAAVLLGGGLDEALERLVDRLVVEGDAHLDAELGGEEAADPAATDPVGGDHLDARAERLLGGLDRGVVRSATELHDRRVVSC